MTLEFFNALDRLTVALFDDRPLIEELLRDGAWGLGTNEPTRPSIDSLILEAASLNETWVESFWAQVRMGPGCWEWQGNRADNGYGFVYVPGRDGSLFVHRIAYVLSKGPIADGMEVDHLCFNRLCVNPADLEPVWPRENIRRSWVHRREAAG